MDELETPPSEAQHVTASATIHGEGDAPVLVLHGQLDLSSVEEVRPVVDELLAREPTRLIVDVGGLEFMDSSGIALLLVIATKLRRLELRNPSLIIRRVIETTGLSGTLLIDP